MLQPVTKKTSARITKIQNKQWLYINNLYYHPPAGVSMFRALGIQASGKNP